MVNAMQIQLMNAVYGKVAIKLTDLVRNDLSDKQQYLTAVGVVVFCVDSHLPTRLAVSTICTQLFHKYDTVVVAKAKQSRQSILQLNSRNGAQMGILYMHQLKHPLGKSYIAISILNAEHCCRTFGSSGGGRVVDMVRRGGHTSIWHAVEAGRRESSNTHTTP